MDKIKFIKDLMDVGVSLEEATRIWNEIKSKDPEIKNLLIRSEKDST